MREPRADVVAYVKRKQADRLVGFFRQQRRENRPVRGQHAALEHLCRQVFAHTLVFDMHVPVVDSLEACRCVRQRVGGRRRDADGDGGWRQE